MQMTANLLLLNFVLHSKITDTSLKEENNV